MTGEGSITALSWDDLYPKASVGPLPEIPPPAPFADGWPEPESRKPQTATQDGLNLVGLGELLSRPVVPVDYLWQGRLVAGSVSIIASKPKVGKSTLARNLALAVARGESFLGWSVKHGAVLYFCLEERVEDVVSDFRKMGASGSEDIHFAEAASVPKMVGILKDRKPALLVVDPLFRLVQVRDGNSYAELYSALGPLIDAARQTGTHILCLHHSSKATKADAIDSPIGSTALGGAVSTLISMKRTEKYRTLGTVQRIGEDLSETVLRFDPATRRLSLGGLRENAEVASLGGAILAALAEKRMSESEICEAVKAKNYLKRKALRELSRQGKITRLGSGKRGNPFEYEIACTLVPDPIKNSGYEKPIEGVLEEPIESEKKVVPVVRNIYGYESTRNLSPSIECINIGEKVVPAKTENFANSEKPGTSNYEAVWL